MVMTVEAQVAQFSQPVRQIIQMLAVLVFVAVGAYAILPALEPVIMANPFLNGLILVVFLIGVIACFLQVFQLTTSVRWIEGFAGDHGAPSENPPRLLAPLAALLRSRAANRHISSTSANSILESVATRIEEARDITRYLVSLLIFLGLLGTFYGLATTVPAVVETIRSLAPQEGEGGVEVFARLMSGLEAQLGGMGTAFSSSLLGLAGSLVVGLLELFASRGQNRFYRELEEWMSSITRIGFSSGEGEGGGEVGNLYSVLDYMGEQMESMRQMFTQSDVNRAILDDKLTEVANSVATLTATLQQGGGTAEALNRVADGQEALLRRLNEGRATAIDTGDEDEEFDAESRMRLRSIDTQLLRILEELSAGRQETLAELRADIATLTRELRRGRPGGTVPGGGPRPRDAAAGPRD